MNASPDNHPDSDLIDAAEAGAVRAALLGVAGHDNYKKFLLELHGRCQSKRRLFYWQEQLWSLVRNQLGLPMIGFEAITRLLQYCHVHDADLEPDVVPVKYGTWHLAGDYVDAMETSFPNANEFVMGPCWEEPPDRREVFQCAACRDARKKWLALNARQ